MAEQIHALTMTGQQEFPPVAGWGGTPWQPTYPRWPLEANVMDTRIHRCTITRIDSAAKYVDFAAKGHHKWQIKGCLPEPHHFESGRGEEIVAAIGQLLERDIMPKGREHLEQLQAYLAN